MHTEDFVSKIRWETAGLYDLVIHAAIVKMFSTVTQMVPESYRPAKFVSVGKNASSDKRSTLNATTARFS
jgi:hypothetical protein